MSDMMRQMDTAALVEQRARYEGELVILRAELAAAIVERDAIHARATKNWERGTAFERELSEATARAERLAAVMEEKVLLSDAEKWVVSLRRQYISKWRDQDQDYWFKRLMQEVGELASSLAGDHDDPPEHELKQIAAICINWLEMRAELAGAGGAGTGGEGSDK